MERFVLIDESLTSNKFWVRIAGIDLKQFKKNPIMYWMHQRASGYDGQNQVLPIGKWKDIKTEQINGFKAITAEPVFDEDDEFALKIKNKVEKGFIKMASSGLDPITWTENKEHLKAGQTRATLWDSAMSEASIVDRGANYNAVRLYNEHLPVNLSASENKNFIPKININQSYNMKEIALKLGLKEDASQETILAAISENQKNKQAAEQKLADIQADRIKILLGSDAVNDDNREHLEKLAEQDFDLAQKTVSILEQKQEKAETKTDDGVRLSDAIKKNTKSDEPKTWKDLSDKERLNLRENNSVKYIELFKSEYGFDPEMN